MRNQVRIAIVIPLFLVCCTGAAQAEVTASADTAGAFIIINSVDLPVPPEEAFDMMTGDISGWWDHSFSDHPSAMYIEPKPGGSFLERFDEAGNGVQHAVVNWSQRGKMLKFTGPLGLSGRAVTMVHTWTYEATETGCKVTCEVHASGEIDGELAKIVDSVWQHFLIERLKPFVENKLEVID